MRVRAVEILAFVEDYVAIQQEQEDVDTSGLTACYLLLSFAFEMILKSRIVVLSNTSDIGGLNDELKKCGHDFKRMADILSQKQALVGIGIKSVVFVGRKGDYIIQTINGKEFFVADFYDIRYGFMDKIISRSRNVLRNEYQRIQGIIDEMTIIKTLTAEQNKK